MTKVAVVGAGPAGSAFVLSLVELGVDPSDIVMFDRATFPRPKLCGGALTWRGTEALTRLLGERPTGGAVTRSLEFRCALGAFHVRERGPQWLYDRAYIDNHLLGRCIEAGVEVRQACSVRSLREDGDGHQLEWKSTLSGTGAEKFDWIVGADGARGVVGRSVGLGGGIVGRLVEAAYRPTTTELDPNVLYFDFDPIIDGIPGYAWLFPYPKPGTEGLWKVGIMDGRGVVPGERLREWTDAYAQRYGFERVDPKIAGWPERYFSRKTKAHRPGVILTGEAWGIDPLLGEGIAPALEMGAYAAARVKEALHAGRSTIPRYEKDFLKTEEGRNLQFQSRLADLIYGGASHRWLRVLFGHEYMLALAESGTEAYGRLEKHTWKLVRSYIGQVMRKGFPSNAPIPNDLGSEAAPSA